MDRLLRTAAAVGAVVWGLAAGAGCVHKTSGLEVTGVLTPAGDGGQELVRAVWVHSPKLGRRLHVADARHEHAGDLLKASVTLASQVDTTLKVQVRFAWFNANGLEEDPGTDAWTPVVLYGRETRTVQAVAPNAAVTAFQLRVRD